MTLSALRGNSPNGNEVIRVPKSKNARGAFLRKRTNYLRFFALFFFAAFFTVFFAAFFAGRLVVFFAVDFLATFLFFAAIYLNENCYD